jgi:hypothetical protein
MNHPPRRGARQFRARFVSSVVGALIVACGAPPTVDTTAAETDTSTTGDEVEVRPNWHEDIAPIVHAHCVGCHVEGSIAPFALDDYAGAAPWAGHMVAAVDAQIMPPWGAQDTPECQVAHAWLGDPRLSEAERAALSEWEQLGAPEGAPEDAAPLPSPVVKHLEDPDGIYHIPDPFVIGGVNEIYTCITIDPGITEDVWITGAEVVVDNEALVHHGFVMIDPLGTSVEIADANGYYPCNGLDHPLGWLTSYFPGAGPTLMPEDVGVPLPVGGRVVLSLHYHPVGGPTSVDQSGLALRWTTEPPNYEAVISAVGNAATAAQGLHFGPADPNGIPTFLIPAGTSGHTETMSTVFPDDIPESKLFMLTPHMHHLGTDFRVTLERDGETSCLIQNPHWDFDWQLIHAIDGEQPGAPSVRAGDRIELRCTYDNSLANPALVDQLAVLGLDAPVDAYLGDAGVNEMCMLVYGIAVPRG